MSARDGSVAGLLRTHHLVGCETALGAYITRQRWGGAQGRTIHSTEIVDAAEISASDPVLLHTLTEITFTDSRSTRYALPLGIRPAGDSIAERVPEFMIPWAQAPDAMQLYDAVGDDAYIQWLLDAIRYAASGRDDERTAAVLMPGPDRPRHRQPLLGAPSAG